MDKQTRSKASIIALASWWAAAVLAVAAWWALNSGDETATRIGVWLVGFAALGSVAGWGSSIGALLHDAGRVRIGVICLLALPVVGIVFGFVATNSTVVGPTDPVMAGWLVVSALLLIGATLFICAPSER